MEIERLREIWYVRPMRYLIIASLCLALAPAVAAADEPVRAGPVKVANEFTPPKPKKGYRYPDCFCTDSEGKRVEMGMTSCLKIGSQSFLARCGMSLNNPTWRRVDDTCPAPSS